MNILVTAGNTLVPIDRVRAITNIFTGRTGAAIALFACSQGHAVTLLTSHPEVVDELRLTEAAPAVSCSSVCSVRKYRTFDDLQGQMEELVGLEGLDAVIHCAAVSDYRSAGVYAPSSGTHFRPEDSSWLSDRGHPALEDRAAGKVKSDEPELWLRLVRTPKLVDRIRSQWKFRGLLVKFKLEVGVNDETLLEVAERSRLRSQANLMVANTLEGAGSWAYIGPLGGGYRRVSRRELPQQLLAALATKHAEGRHG
jgi:phosphopantothenoylcysteine synthetase/decarboxylase